MNCDSSKMQQYIYIARAHISLRIPLLHMDVGIAIVILVMMIFERL